MFIFRLIVSVIYVIVFCGGLLLLPAGTLAWWRAWAFLGVVAVAQVATMLSVFRRNEALLKERLKPPVQKGQPLADKIVLIRYKLIPYLW